MLSVEDKAACLRSGIFQSLDDEILTSIAERMGQHFLVLKISLTHALGNAG